MQRHGKIKTRSGTSILTSLVLFKKYGYFMVNICKKPSFNCFIFSDIWATWVFDCILTWNKSPLVLDQNALNSNKEDLKRPLKAKINACLCLCVHRHYYTCVQPLRNSARKPLQPLDRASMPSRVIWSHHDRFNISSILQPSLSNTMKVKTKHGRHVS